MYKEEECQERLESSNDWEVNSKDSATARPLQKRAHPWMLASHLELEWSVDEITSADNGATSLPEAKDQKN